MKTSELIGTALDWAVAKCEGVSCFGAPVYRSEAAEFLIMHSDDPALHYSTHWSQGGPIIDREMISVEVTCMGLGFEWSARCDPMENASYGEYGLWNYQHKTAQFNHTVKCAKHSPK